MCKSVKVSVTIKVTRHLFRFVTTPAACPRRYGDQPFFVASDSTALAGYANVMMMRRNALL